MKRAPLPASALLLGGALLAVPTLSADQSIATFDNLATGNTFFAGTWAAGGSTTGTTSPAAGLAQDSGVFDVTGVTQDADSYLEIHYSSAPLDLSGYDAISLAGSTLSGNQASSLEVRLFDTAGASAYAAIETSALPAVVAWVADQGFNPAAVEIARVSGGQLESNTALAIRLDEINAVNGPVSFHDGDYDRNSRFDLTELLRVIQLYNTRNGTTRTGRYLVSSGTVDGYDPDPATVLGSTPGLARFHSADYDDDAQISLTELLRVIELYNTRSGTTRTGEYHRQQGTADGFAAGPQG